jgi:hypothetical protein
MSSVGGKRGRTEPSASSTAAAVAPDSGAAQSQSAASVVLLPDIGAAKRAVLADWRANKIPPPYGGMHGMKNKSLAEDLAGPHERKSSQRDAERNARAVLKQAKSVQKGTGRTMLSTLATSVIDEECVKLAVDLVEAGADVNARDAQGNTPLHAAVNNGCLQLATLLVELGADPLAPNDAEDCPVEMTPMGPKGAGFAQLWQRTPMPSALPASGSAPTAEGAASAPAEPSAVSPKNAKTRKTK